MRAVILALAFGSVVVSAQSLSPAQRVQFHGPYSEAAEPFRIMGNIYYVGARNISSILFTTPQGHILLDSGTIEMVPVIRANVEKLGFKMQDIKILLSNHAHFDHVGGHAAIKRATGARVMVMEADAPAIRTGADLSPLADEGWEGVAIDRVLKDGDTVALGGATLVAHWTPGHTPGCTTWSTTAQEAGKSYSIVFVGCGAPNGGIKLAGNPKFPTLVEDTQRTYRVLRSLKPDLYLTMHPQAMLADKIERIVAGARPHPLIDPAAWEKLVNDGEANFKKRLEDEQKQNAPKL